MNELEPRKSPPSLKELNKQGVNAVFGVGGGIALWALGSLPPLPGMILGGAALVVGVGSLLSKDPDDKKPGTIALTAGILSFIARSGIPLLKPISGTLLGLGALGLVSFGVWNAIKFFKGLKAKK
ncbi:hypothetical protein FACS1894172_13100 [Spirochaetia bacterium]|nr:hypothetical protein FACS1894164_09370 [Spirochaetia bacterium]GHU33813.1 hypothetical protein FACS1894172_13100 [Spirochaetia bacterium]